LRQPDRATRGDEAAMVGDGDQGLEAADIHVALGYLVRLSGENSENYSSRKDFD
jgi:hypothetical protein